MDVSFLRPLYDHDGPWASVYLDLSRDTEDAAEAIGVRSRDLAAQLAADGADDKTLAAIHAGLMRDRRSPGVDSGVALFASRGVLRLAVPLPAPPTRDTAVLTALPHTVPLLFMTGEQTQVPWVRAVVDRTGADLVAVDGDGARRSAEVRGGADYPLRKPTPGGWSQMRYQHAAEQNWAHNAEPVAKAMVDLADEIDARVLVLAGDVRARQLVRHYLPRRVAEHVMETTAGGRAPGAKQAPLEEFTTQTVRAEAEEWRSEVLDAYRREWGRHASAVAGLPAVVGALARAQVRALLIDRDRWPEMSMWVGPELRQLALDPADLAAAGVDRPQPAAAGDALVRAAVGEQAEIVAVSAAEVDLPDGVGAVLRYSDQAGVAP